MSDGQPNVVGAGGLVAGSGSPLLDAAGALAAQPLFILSTAAQELFHTNFLYWLVREHTGTAAEPVLRALRMPKTAKGPFSGAVLRREYKHVDLYLDHGRGSWKLVIENKLAAIPNPDQLLDYIKASSDPNATAYTLLTLLPAGEVPDPWQAVRYDDLLEPLHEAAGLLEAGFDRQLIEQYRQVVAGLIALRDAVEPGAGAMASTAWLLTAAERAQLRELRVLPLVEKMRGLLLAREIRRRCGDPTLRLEVALSNSLGLISYYTDPNADTHQVGWQLQGRQFRLAVATRADRRFHGPDLRPEREAFVAATYATHFDFGRYDPDHILRPAQTRKTWLGFDPDFVYTYRNVTGRATWDQIVDLCIAGIIQARRSY